MSHERFRVFPSVDLRDALRRDLKRMPGGLASAAPVIGVSSAQCIANYTCGTKRGFLVCDPDSAPRFQSAMSSMTLDQFELALDYCAGVNVAHAVAEAAGGMFIQTAYADIEGDLMPQLSLAIERLGALTRTVTDAVADHRVTGAELKAVKLDQVSLREAVDRLVAIVEKMRD